MTSKLFSSRLILCGIMILGACLRFYGLDWGTDWQTGFFHRFHTDESTIVESAQWVAEDQSEIRSSYGKAPMYLLWASTHILSPIVGIPAFENENPSLRFAHLTGRYISAIMGTVVIYFVYQLGLALGGIYTGLLAAFLMAVCPGHIQQSHYYTVDPFITFWTTFGLFLLLKMPSKDWWPYVAFGLICGLAAGTRFVGAWVGLPFLIIHMFRYKPDTSIFSTPVQLTQSDTLKRIATVIGLGALTLIACEPNLIIDPQYYFLETDARQFATSLQVARGEVVRVWTLYDFHTIPYLFYITHLFRYALGFPLELAGLLGLCLALVKRTQPAIILLGWFFAYFILVGGLHTKPVRYTTPLLPVLTVLGAWFCIWVTQKLQEKRVKSYTYVIPILCVALPTSAYGLALTAIYGKEDSRILAERWIQTNIPPKSHVLSENGGYPTAWMFPEDQYNRQVTDSNYFIVSNKWELYSVQMDFFAKRLHQVEWIVIIEENRMKPFMSVPQKYPIGSEIYAQLKQEALGFEEIRHFKNHPALGITTYETTAQPTLTAFDHPTVRIYRRTPDASPQEILRTRRQAIQTDPQLPDKHILDGVAAFKESRWEAAKNAFESALKLDPEFVLAKLLIGEIYIKHNKEDETQKIWDKINEHRNIDKYAFIGMINAGLEEEGIIYLESIAKMPGADPNLMRLASQTYIEIAQAYQEKNDLQNALANHTKALTLTPSEPAPYLNAAFILIELGDLENAQQLLDHLQKIAPNIPMALHAQALLLQKQNQLDTAFEKLLQALKLDPENMQHQTVLLEWGGQYYQQGKIEMAYTIFQEILQHNPNFQEAHYNLGALYLQSGDYQSALPALQKAVALKPNDPDAQFALAGVYETLGQNHQAIEHYHHVLTLNPNHATAKDRLGYLISLE